MRKIIAIYALLLHSLHEKRLRKVLVNTLCFVRRQGKILILTFCLLILIVQLYFIILTKGSASFNNWGWNGNLMNLVAYTEILQVLKLFKQLHEIIPAMMFDWEPLLRFLWALTNVFLLPLQPFVPHLSYLSGFCCFGGYVTVVIGSEGSFIQILL